ncbi:PAS-domain containing protein [Ancylobacter sp. 6x-1]|uniref:histidine kinase n=1 Tax=Ancylobacter crimeensis TaxID=2579147 RepID=A0ABT0DAU1_9HYPH|nr:PAS domain-containing sensor histidine kinase [Ancylobacter crimeensis]MCK0197076.1 PAS-domain containing protein [Ancylobacter crimeensis]
MASAAARPFRRALLASASLASLLATAGTAMAVPLAGPFGDAARALGQLDRGEVTGLAFMAGLLAFATTTAIVHLRFRRFANAREAEAHADISRLEAQLAESRALLLTEPQVIVVWREPAGAPEILGPAVTLTGSAAPLRLLAFGSWLAPGSASAIDHAVDDLRRAGIAFTLPLVTHDGRHVEAEGRPVGSAVMLRLREVTGARQELAATREDQRRLEGEAAGLRSLLGRLQHAAWLRDGDGRLVWANAAYAHAVEASDAGDAVARDLPLLDHAGRRSAHEAQAKGGAYAARLPVIVAGSRRVLDVVEVATGDGFAGLALDATEAESVRAEFAHAVAAHRRTLDRLSTAVAIFGGDRRLVFHNAAYARLFDLDPAFLEDRPSDSAVLDRLRTTRRLPEQADFRAWREELHKAYHAIEPREHAWHLPGGRTLRVVTAPNPEGGVTYLADEVTEHLALESRVDALARLQTETLDGLAEAVAVFGSDGRLGLSNPAFATLWQLPPGALADRPHIDRLMALCAGQVAKPEIWRSLREAVTTMEKRAPLRIRMERRDGSVLDGATQPLPDGGTLITFRNVTDSVKMERALVERNEALEAADHLKSTFVSHVSYELRSPLTTIIGFAQLLGDDATGPLAPKQRDYVSHITESSAALLAIINDILDLATIDAGTMALELGTVDIRAAMEAAAEGIRDRVAEREIRLVLEVSERAGSFLADERRVRQILYNLLSNAVGFAPEGSTVTLSAERTPEAVRFRVRDEGPGIAPELASRVFDRFESRTSGSRHRGVGLGLSIVRSLMELHGGLVQIGAAPGGGTLVTCTFPLDRDTTQQAAE